MSDSFCRVDTALTETVCEFLATVVSRLADSFLSRGYGRDVFLSDSLRVLAATSKRLYSARNCRQFQHVEDHGTTHRYRSRVTRNREIVEREPRTFIHILCNNVSFYRYRVSQEDGSMPCDRPVNVLLYLLFYYCAKLHLLKLLLCH